ncbi:MAG: GNAT family N-acetyltransferase [Rhizomicrobium sp.]
MPILESERLVLRPPRPADIQAMTVWLGDFQVSKNLAMVPHPYGEADAEEFVTGAGHRFMGPMNSRNLSCRNSAQKTGLRVSRNCSGEEAEGGGHHAFSIVRRADRLFLGGIGLRPGPDGHELGYWLGRPFWGFGYASEAATGVMRFAFERLGLSFVHAGWFHDNPASGQVLAKLGACHNGSRVRACLARGAPVLCHEMLLTREAFLSKKAGHGAAVGGATVNRRNDEISRYC